MVSVSVKRSESKPRSLVLNACLCVCLSVCLSAGEQLIVVETTESDFPGVDSVDRVLCALDLPVAQPPAPSMRSRPLVNTRPAVPSR